jgi:hypothetical protein
MGEGNEECRLPSGTCSLPFLTRFAIRVQKE